MKLTEKVIESATNKKSRDETKHIVLDGLNLSSATVLEKYQNVEYLSLRFNQLQFVNFVKKCQNLWILELQQNPITDFAALNSLLVLGYLSLTVNSVKQLKTLSELHVVECSVLGSVGRKELIENLPRAWIINGKYVTIEEKANVKEEAVGSAVPVLTTYVTNQRKRSFLEKFTPSEKFANPNVIEQQKLRYIIEDLEYKCELDWNKGPDPKDGKIRLRFPIFQLQRWTTLGRSSQVILVLYICLYFHGFISGKVFAHIVHCIISDTYKNQDTMIEAEGLCRLPTHYLLGLLIYLKQRLELKLWPDSNITDTQFEEHIEKLMENVNVDLLLLALKSLIQREPTTAKEFYNSSAKGPISDLPAKYYERMKLICEVGVNILKLYNLFTNYTKPCELQHIRPMLEALGMLKKKLVNEKANPATVVRIPKTSVSLKRDPTKCSFLNYEINLPPRGPSKNTANKLMRTGSTRLKTAFGKTNTSKSLVPLSCEPVHVFSNDLSFSPTFILSSQKSLANLTQSPSQKGDWTAVGPNLRYLTYKETYYFY